MKVTAVLIFLVFATVVALNNGWLDSRPVTQNHLKIREAVSKLTSHELAVGAAVRNASRGYVI